MSRIPALTVEQAPAASVPLLEGVQKAFGILPNVFKTLAHSPAALGSYLQFSQAFGTNSLSAVEREAIALAVTQVNECEYCLAAHTMFGAKAGMSAEDMRNARDGYLRWGAAGKARQLEELYPHLREAASLPGPTSTIEAPLEQLDLAAVMKAAIAITAAVENMDGAIPAAMETAAGKAATSAVENTASTVETTTSAMTTTSSSTAMTTTVNLGGEPVGHVFGRRCSARIDQR